MTTQVDTKPMTKPAIQDWPLAKPNTWIGRITQARKHGGFTDEDFILARSWRTCAVGERTTEHQIPLGNSFDTPVDGILYDLGLEFADCVGREQIDEAERVLFAIGDRVEELTKPQDKSEARR